MSVLEVREVWCMYVDNKNRTYLHAYTCMHTQHMMQHDMVCNIVWGGGGWVAHPCPPGGSMGVCGSPYLPTACLPPLPPLIGTCQRGVVGGSGDGGGGLSPDEMAADPLENT